jgi:hypothetical protein
MQTLLADDVSGSIAYPPKDRPEKEIRYPLLRRDEESENTARHARHEFASP